jgi:hypothetical protein
MARRKRGEEVFSDVSETLILWYWQHADISLGG